jgi:hypothetical protein
MTCRACRAPGQAGDVVLDLGLAPAADYFPLPTDPLPDPAFDLSMWCCPACGLAQLTVDESDTSEPRAVEPEALRLQANDAVSALAAAGLLAGRRTVGEFGSPHGGSWLNLFADQGLDPVSPDAVADVVVDSFGLMHAPDQRAAIHERVEMLSDSGVLVLQFHSVEAIVGERQWNALRHGHFAYYSLSSLIPLLASVGLTPDRAWEFDLYGKTVMVTATRSAAGSAHPPAGGRQDPTVQVILKREAELSLTQPDSLRTLQSGADLETTQLGNAIRAKAKKGRRVFAYGAASRAVALLSRAGLTAQELLAVGDASPSKHGRTMPGTRIPIIGPQELVSADPDEVLLLLPDLLPELLQSLPQLAGRWKLPPYAS